MGAHRQGAMLAAGLSEDEALRYLKQDQPGLAVVACVNSPSSVTLAGDLATLSELEAAISADGKFARVLKVQTAYHSPHMACVAKDYLKRLESSLRKDLQGCVSSTATFFSSVTGEMHSSEELGPSYWVQNMTGQVRFSTAVNKILAHKVPFRPGGRPSAVNWTAVVEIGPHCALQGPIGQILKESNVKATAELQYISVLRRGEDAEISAMKAAGSMWSLGHRLNFDSVNPSAGSGNTPKVISDLPPYPWNHSRRFWHESQSTRSIRLPSAPRNDFLGIPVENQNPMEQRWRNHLRVSGNPWIEHHCITGHHSIPSRRHVDHGR
jgi:acyl transferase domain-containing protein